jgi:hypothetical protein
MGILIVWALAIGSCFHVYRQLKKHLPAEQDGGYSKAALPNGGYKFTVKPNTVPKAQMSGGGILPIIVFGFAWMIFTSILLSLKIGGVAFLLGVLFSVYPTYAVSFFVKGMVKKAAQKNIGREAMEFTVDENSVAVAGKNFPESSIARLVIRNIIDQAEVPYSSPGVVPVVNAGSFSGAAVGMASVITSASADGQRNALRRIANALYLEAGGNQYLLGSGLNDVQAFGLLKEVSDVLGYQTK